MTLTEAEKLQLEGLLHSNICWDDPLLSLFKNKIKEEFLTEIKQCCYCARSFHGEFKFVIDIEHILPKSLFRKQMLDVANLSIACKRCNMMIKKDRIDFLDGLLSDVADFFKNNKSENDRENFLKDLGDMIFKDSCLIFSKSEYYKFIHPNLDEYYSHLDIEEIRKKGNIFKKYYPEDSKGLYTYEYFKLKELEQGDLNSFQGIEFQANNSSLILNEII